MTKTPKRPRDSNQWAKGMVDIATREATDRGPTERMLGRGDKVGVSNQILR
jgi:hypothetical protein